MDAPQQLLAIGQADLLSAIVEYVIESKAGDTLSYRETAALDVEVAARSSADVLWGKLVSRCSIMPTLSDEERTALEPGETIELVAEPARIRFTAEAASDLAQCFIDADGTPLEEGVVMFDVFTGSDGKTLFAQSVTKPQNGAFAIGAGSTGELLNSLDADELKKIAQDADLGEMVDAIDAGLTADNSAFF